MTAAVPSRHLTAVAAAYAASAAVYSKLPAPNVTADHRMSLGRPIIAFLLPTAALLTYGLLRRLWMRDPIRDRNAAIEATFEAIVFRIVRFIIGIHVAVLAGLLDLAGGRPHVVPALARVVPVLLGLAFMGVGNLLPRLRQNVVIGIRTSRALADRCVWLRTNRAGGYVAVGLGAMIAVSAALLPPGVSVRIVISAAALVAAGVLVAYCRKYARA